MIKPLQVEIWSDLICPWCGIGLRRFERVVGAFDQASNVKVVHRAFRLAPGSAPVSVEETLAKRHMSPNQITDMLRRTESTALAEGLTYRLSGTMVGDTLDGHRLVKLAGTVGRQHELIKRFFEANFTEHRPPFGREPLLQLAAEAGIARDIAGEVLDGDRFLAEVEADQRFVEAAGGRGVPFFLVGGRRALSGAQPAEIFSKTLAQAWHDLSAA